MACMGLWGLWEALSGHGRPRESVKTRFSCAGALCTLGTAPWLPVCVAAAMLRRCEEPPLVTDAQNGPLLALGGPRGPRRADGASGDHGFRGGCVTGDVYDGI